MPSFTYRSPQALHVMASLLLILALGACHKESSQTDSAKETANTLPDTAAVDIQDHKSLAQTGNNEENTGDGEEKGVAKQGDDAKSLEKPSNDYDEMRKEGFPIPTVEGEALEYLSAQVNEDKTAVFYAYKDAAFKSQYEKSLAKAGFLRKANHTYVKERKNQPALIVKLFEREDRFYIGMFTTTDPFGLYKNMPDARILYPLEDGVLALRYSSYTVYDISELDPYLESGSLTSQAKARRDMFYTYKQVPKSFVDDYSKRLKKAAYENYRIPESPRFCKTWSDKVQACITYDLIDYDEDTKLWDEVKFEMTVRQLN
ncbi:MAG: hypothetical protein WC966_07680 [Bradymonadales bacterium]|jgi:hypothetical protein